MSTAPLACRPWTAEASSRFAGLLERFERRTGCPMLLNTSFNMRGEPIVCTPADAILCFVRSQIDALVVEDFLLDREQVPSQWKDLAPPLRRPEVSISHQVYTLL